MKKVVIFIFILFSINVFSIDGKEKSNKEFTNEEIKEMGKYGEIQILKENGMGKIDSSKYKVIYFNVDINETEKIYQELRESLDDKRYQVFFTGVPIDENSSQKMCILKSNDKYESLRAFETNGGNYGIDTEILIKRLKNWDSLYKIDIVGVDVDWVFIILENLPKDIDKFSEEVYRFCPDVVEQGVGSMEALKNSIKESKGIFLWWD